MVIFHSYVNVYQREKKDIVLKKPYKKDTVQGPSWDDWLK
jgi:hypothetical protein